jgi:Flp pilus assembly protein TadG
MVEFALGLPLLLAMIIGIIEIGRLVLAFTVVGNVAREGARYAIMTTVAAAPATMPEEPGYTEAAKPAWWQYCNAGHSGTSVTYNATDARCVGWPNVVSTVVGKSPGMQVDRVMVTVSYTTLTGTLDGYNRSVPITVEVNYTHTILFAHFLRLPSSLSTVTVKGTSTMLTQ